MNNLYATSFAAVTFFGGAALTILFYRLEIRDSAVIIALLIAPLLVYGIASGNILELSAPGGWTAKFHEIAKQDVSSTAVPIADSKPLTDQLNDLQYVEKEGIAKLQEILPKLQKGKPIALILYLGKHNYYVPNIVRQYVEGLQTVDPSVAVIVEDNSTKRFICAIDGASFLRLNDFASVVQAIGDGNRNPLSLPGFVFRGIRDTKSNIDALREMKSLDTTFLVVLNDGDIPISLVRRDEILQRFIDKLT